LTQEGQYDSERDQVEQLGPIQEVTLSYSEITEPERGEYLKNPSSILFRWSNQEVNVTGIPWMAMKRHGVTTDNKKLNVVRVQQDNELSQIGLQFRQEHSGDVRSVPAKCRAVPLG
jgi:hypothetical protein